MTGLAVRQLSTECVPDLRSSCTEDSGILTKDTVDP